MLISNEDRNLLATHQVFIAIDTENQKGLITIQNREFRVTVLRHPIEGQGGTSSSDHNNLSVQKMEETAAKVAVILLKKELLQRPLEGGFTIDNQGITATHSSADFCPHEDTEELKNTRPDFNALTNYLSETTPAEEEGIISEVEEEIHSTPQDTKTVMPHHREPFKLKRPRLKQKRKNRPDSQAVLKNQPLGLSNNRLKLLRRSLTANQTRVTPTPEKRNEQESQALVLRSRKKIDVNAPIFKKIELQKWCRNYFRQFHFISKEILLDYLTQKNQFILPPSLNASNPITTRKARRNHSKESHVPEIKSEENREEINRLGNEILSSKVKPSFPPQQNSTQLPISTPFQRTIPLTHPSSYRKMIQMQKNIKKNSVVMNPSLTLTPIDEQTEKKKLNKTDDGLPPEHDLDDLDPETQKIVDEVIAQHKHKFSHIDKKNQKAPLNGLPPEHDLDDLDAETQKIVDEVMMAQHKHGPSHSAKHQKVSFNPTKQTTPTPKRTLHPKIKDSQGDGRPSSSFSGLPLNRRLITNIVKQALFRR
ncbi:MAG: hypothetical protein ACH350_04295 [Parachlamydiaceae bacterium]